MFKKIKNEVNEIKAMMEESTQVYEELAEDMKRDKKRFDEERIKLLVQDAWIRGRANIPLSEKYAFECDKQQQIEGCDLDD